MPSSPASAATSSCSSGRRPQPASAAALADRLLAAVADDLDIDGTLLRVGLSVGIAIFPSDGTDAGTLIGNADAALYRAKAQGRGTICFSRPAWTSACGSGARIQQELRAAVARGELVLHYQPQARIGGKIVGFEALVRWKHPTRGLISAGNFHSDCGRERPDPADRRMGAARGLPRSRLLAAAAADRGQSLAGRSSTMAICPG